MKGGKGQGGFAGTGMMHAVRAEFGSCGDFVWEECTLSIDPGSIRHCMVYLSSIVCL